MGKAKVVTLLQFGAIPYRLHRGHLECLLVTTKSSDRWIIPKGNHEPYMQPYEIAAVEAREEAGVFGRVNRTPLGIWKNKKQNGVITVQTFPLEVKHTFDQWLEMKQRRRRWFTLQHAMEVIHEESLCDLISHLPGYLYNQGVPLPNNRSLIVTA